MPRMAIIKDVRPFFNLTAIPELDCFIGAVLTFAREPGYTGLSGYFGRLSVERLDSIILSQHEGVLRGGSMNASEKVNVLLVDDRPENLLVLRATLAPLGLNLMEAQSCKDALKYLLDHEFAAILLDVMMPEVDGFETARLIREREKSKYTPIIFVTAMFLDDADAFRGYSVGAVDYIMKPFVPEILRSKVSVFVDLFRKTEEVRRQAEHIRLMEQREYLAKLVATEDRLRQEAERERAETRAVRAVLEHAPVGFARLGAKFDVIETNPVFAELFSIKEQGIGRPLLENLPGLPESVVKAIQEGRPHRIEALKVRDGAPTETARYCDLAFWPVKGSKGEHSGTILVASDVSERVLREQQRKDFVATLAHDLQTPVIASDRALSLLLNQIPDTLAPELINLAVMLKKNNKNLLHMIESLLDVYHYEEGASALYFDKVDLTVLINTCIEELMPLATQEGIKLGADLPQNLSPVYADRTAIRRVITNLLDNSLKFTPSGGSISVRAQNCDEFVSIEVSDTGVGIKPEDQAYLFERYWHGKGHTKTFKGSSGLGLYVCRQIVEAHHGRIECDSEVDKLTTFRVTLPVRKRSAEQPADAVQVDSSPAKEPSKR